VRGEKAAEAAGARALDRKYRRGRSSTIFLKASMRGTDPLTKYSAVLSKLAHGQATGQEKETTGRRYKKAIEEFLDSLGARVDKPLGRADTSGHRAFSETSEASRGVSAATVKLDLKLVRRRPQHSSSSGAYSAQPRRSD